MKVYFINLADGPDFDDENEVPNEPVPRKKSINCQNNFKNIKNVRPKGGLKTLDLDGEPIIIDDELYTNTPEKNVPTKFVGSGQNAETKISNNSGIYINPNVIIIDDDSTNNSEIVFRNEDDNARVDDTSVLRDNNTVDVNGELINSDNVEESRFTIPSPTNINILEESSEVLVNGPPEIDYNELSKVLETVSTDLNSMLGSDEIENNNLDIPPITTTEDNCVTSVDVENDVPNVHNRVKLLENNKEIETNTVEMGKIQELSELPYLDIKDVNPSIYLEDGAEIEGLDIIKDTEINLKDVHSEIALDSSMDVEDSNAILDNDFVSNALENYVEVPESNVDTDFSDPKDVVDLESVILQNNMDMVDLDDVNTSVEIEKVLEDVDPEDILENDEFDPKALENCFNVLDPNVIEDSVSVIDPQSKLEFDLNFLQPNTVTQISSSMEVDDSNIICGRSLDDVNPKNAVRNKINIIESTNVQIEYFTRDSEGNMQITYSKILDKGEVQDPKMKKTTQSKHKTIETEKLPTSVNNVSAPNMLTDFDLTGAKPSVLSDPGAFEIPSNQNLCDLGKFVSEDIVCKKTTEGKITKFYRPTIKTLSGNKQIIGNEEEQIQRKNQNSETQDGDQSILTDSMLDIITSNLHTNTKDAERIMEIVSDLEESIAKDLHCRNVSTNTFDADFDNIDEDEGAVKRNLSKNIEFKETSLEELDKDISIEELVKVSVPLDGRSRTRKFKNKKTQTDSRRVKPSPQFVEEMREAGLIEQIQPPSQSLEGPEFKGNFKHICTICNSRYDRISRLRIHMRRHNKDLKFQCELCDSKFVVQYELDRHHRIVHLGNKKKGKLDYDSGIPLSKTYPHKCDYCRMFFQTTTGLREHMKKRHAKEMFLMEANKPVECDVCQKKFIKSFIADHKAKAHTPPIVVLEHSLPDLN